MKARTHLLGPFCGLALRRERWEFTERVMGAVRLGLILALVVPSAGCVDLGPSRTQRFDLQGIITSASDGLPVEGSKVFLTVPCSGLPLCIVSWSGSRPAYDTVVTDAIGRYHLDTRFFCPANFSAVASGFDQFMGRGLECGGPAVLVVNVTLTPCTSVAFPCVPSTEVGLGETIITV